LGRSDADREGARQERGDSLRLSLLGGFEVLLDGRLVALNLGAERLVAFLALHRQPLERPYVAGSLWPDTSERQAFANLRSCLWRVNSAGAPLVVTANRRLGLSPVALVDYHESSVLAERVVHGEDARRVTDAQRALLTRTLLPDWYADWVLLERERHRQLCLLALESLAERLAAADAAVALECALSAVVLEPLRETAHRRIIEIHLSAGNLVDAIRQYRLFTQLLGDQLGLEPSPPMRAMMTALVGDAAVTLR
jgi:DNA-binding SARP family transcriptional activator